jgi:DNA-binding HxlR family transcriptional regulator
LLILSTVPKDQHSLMARNYRLPPTNYSCYTLHSTGVATANWHTTAVLCAGGSPRWHSHARGNGEPTGPGVAQRGRKGHGGMTRGEADFFGCPVARTALIISNKWTPLIVRDLEQGERRFSELERSLLGISPKTLSERLKHLESERIIERRGYAEVPPRVEYSLTEKGRALLPIIACMQSYGATWLQPNGDEPAPAATSVAAVARAS